MKEKLAVPNAGKGSGILSTEGVKRILYSDQDSLNKRQSQKSNLGGQGWMVMDINSIAPELLYIVR